MDQNADVVVIEWIMRKLVSVSGGGRRSTRSLHW